MKIFNLGALEILFIIFLALIVLGPKKSIKAAGDVAHWIREFIESPFLKDLLSASNEIRDLPKKVLDDADFQKTIDDIDSKAIKVNTSLRDIRKSIQDRTTGNALKFQHEEKMENRSESDREKL